MERIDGWVNQSLEDYLNGPMSQLLDNPILNDSFSIQELMESQKKKIIIKVPEVEIDIDYDTDEYSALPPFPAFSSPINTTPRREETIQRPVSCNLMEFDKIGDKFLHPRKFQDHDISRLVKAGEEYSYQVNRRCPLGENMEAALSYKYIRKRKQKVEVLCRFCPHKWVSFSFYKIHLLFGHGIITGGIQNDKSCPIDPIETADLLPLPIHLLELSKGRFRDLYAQCECGCWILLGKKDYNENEEFLDKFGLYGRYFSHLVSCKLNSSR